MSDNILRKKTTGEAGNGGEFGTKNHSEADISLDEAGAISSEVSYKWIERNVLLTPRHKVPRDVAHNCTAKVSLLSITRDDTDPGFTVTDREWVFRDKDGVRTGRYDEAGGKNESDLEEVERELLIYDGQLYGEVLMADDSGKAVEADGMWMEKRAGAGYRNWYEGATEAEAADHVQSSLDGYISIDGKVWQSTREPVYRIMTFGMGDDHGGTSLTIGIAPETDKNTADDWYVPATQHKAAVERAVQVATDRGDLQSIGGIRATAPIRVHSPNYVAKSWRPATGIEYTSVWNLTAENYQAELTKFRHGIALVVGAVEKIDDGFGGSSSRVDYTKLSPEQESDYKRYLQFGAEAGLI